MVAPPRSTRRSDASLADDIGSPPTAPATAPAGAGIAPAQLIARAPHAMATTVGIEHRLTAANTAFCEAFGVDPSDARGRSIRELLSGLTDADLLALLDQSLQSGDPVETWYPAGRPPGRRLVAWPFFDARSDATGLVVELGDVVSLDETAHEADSVAEQMREINERLLQAALEEQEWADRAAAANRAKSDFLAMVSHELRTPLTGIVAYTDLLLEPNALGPLTDRQLTSLQRIDSCSAHLQELIEDVLRYASIESRVAEIRLERVDVGVLARQAAAVVEPLATSKGLALHISDPDQPLTADTDPRRLRQILLNLIGNAVKFTDSGEVRIAAIDEGGTLRLDVADTGIGIDAGDLGRIFEPFVQVEPVTTRRYGGTGLGLAISRDLARMLGGDVVVSSTAGTGSTFSVRLPHEKPAAA